jgi:hypothetical protein
MYDGMKGRNTPQELQNMKVALIHGIDDDRKGLCVMGWFEDELTGENMVGNIRLYEPLFCQIDLPAQPDQNGQRRPQALHVHTPPNGVPEYGEYNSFYKVEVFEGISAFAGQYISTLQIARQFVPLYSQPTWRFGGSSGGDDSAKAYRR